MNNSYFSSQAGVKFYLDNFNTKVIDIDVMPSVTEVVFTGSKDFMLLDCMKQFKNVKKIKIAQNCSAKISISNFMFPDVKEVESHSARYASGRLLIENGIATRTPYIKTKTLLNTFCADADEEIDISDISRFSKHAFEGCMSENILLANENVYSHDQLSVSLQKSMVKLSIKDSGVHVIKSCSKLKRVIVNVDDGTDTIHIESDMCLSPIASFTTDTLIIDNLDYYTLGFSCSFVKIKAKTIRINDTSEFNIDRISCRPSIQYENFEITGKNIYFKVVDGILYSSDGEQLLCCPQCKKGHVKVQEGCKTLETYAFRYSDIESIYIPDSVKHIYMDCFSDCVNLKDVRLSSNLDKISGGTFSGCVSLESIDIPGSVTEIISHAFMGCSNLKSIKFHDGLTKIEVNSFSNCPALTTLEFPSSLTEIKVSQYYYSNHSDTNISKLILKSPVLNIGYAFARERNAYESYLEEQEKEVGIIEVSIDTGHLKKTFFMPKNLTKAKRKSMNILINRYMQGYEDTDKKLDKLYEMCSTVILKQKTALAIYKKNKNPEVEAYLRRSGKNIAERLILCSKEEAAIEFIELGLLKKSALKSLLDMVKDLEKPALSAYILKAIKKLDGDTSFRL